MKKINCESCMYWRALDRKYLADQIKPGICKRYAPRPATINQNGMTTAEWPTTETFDFCGDYRPKTKRQPQPSINAQQAKTGVT